MMNLRKMLHAVIFCGMIGAVALLLSQLGVADETNWYRDIALRAAEQYDKPALYLYQPTQNAGERAASAVAVTAQVLLEAYRAGGDSSYLSHAKIAADSLIAHSDMNGDGKVGWGRYWMLTGPSGDSHGGNTTFGRGCPLPRNRAYDDELYDDARIARFLVDLYQESHDERYLDAAKRVIDATWAYGDATLGGNGFAYFKTIGPCDHGWHVKNINVLMAVPIAKLSSITGELKYIHRARQILIEEHSQIVGGSPNFGYYANQTMLSKATDSGYVNAAQIISADGSVNCNEHTGSGDSCEFHLGLEARELFSAAKILGLESTYAPTARKILDAFFKRDNALCNGETTPAGTKVNRTACSAYYCALRQLDRKYEWLCRHRVSSERSLSQDTILGLFWGGASR